MRALHLTLASFFALSTSFAMDMSKYGIPNTIRTGTAMGEANAVASPGAIKELLSGELEGFQRPTISAIQVRKLADELSSKAQDADRTLYSPAVKMHVPIEFGRILTPTMLNSIGFTLKDDDIKLGQNYIKLGLNIPHLVPEGTENRKMLTSYAFVLAANKLEEIGSGVNHSDMRLPLEKRQILGMIKLDLAVSRSQLYSWALRQSPHETTIKEAMVDALAESAALMLSVTQESRNLYLPKYTSVYNKLAPAEKDDVNKIITARVIKSLTA